MSMTGLITDRCMKIIQACVMLALMCSPVMARADIAGPYKHVVLLNPGHATETFWAQMIKAASTTAETLGITLEVVSAKRNTDQFIRLGTQIMMREIPPDLLITTNNHGLALPLLDLSDTTSVPVLVVHNTLSTEQYEVSGNPLGQHPYWLGSVAPNHRQGGHDIAQALINRGKSLHGEVRGKVIALVGGLHDEATYKRLSGLRLALRKAPYLMLDRTFQAHWNHGDAFKKVDRYLKHMSEDMPLRIIWAANDAMAIGAIDALRHNGLKPGQDVLVAGMGWTREGIEHLRSGEMAASAGGGALATAWSLTLLAAVQEGLIQPEDIGTRYYTMGVAMSGDPDAFLDSIALPTLVSRSLDYLMSDVASLSANASPFLPMTPRRLSNTKPELKEVGIFAPGAQRHER